MVDTNMLGSLQKISCVFQQFARTSVYRKRYMHKTKIELCLLSGERQRGVENLVASKHFFSKRFKTNHWKKSVLNPNPEIRFSHFFILLNH